MILGLKINRPWIFGQDPFAVGERADGALTAIRSVPYQRHAVDDQPKTTIAKIFDG